MVNGFQRHILVRLSPVSTTAPYTLRLSLLSQLHGTLFQNANNVLCDVSLIHLWTLTSDYRLLLANDDAEAVAVAQETYAVEKALLHRGLLLPFPLEPLKAVWAIDTACVYVVSSTVAPPQTVELLVTAIETPKTLRCVSPSQHVNLGFNLMGSRGRPRIPDAQATGPGLAFFWSRLPVTVNENVDPTERP